MAHSALGKNIFNMAGLAVNAHAYKSRNTDPLNKLQENKYAEETLATFRTEAEAAAVEFKAWH